MAAQGSTKEDKDAEMEMCLQDIEAYPYADDVLFQRVKHAFGSWTAQDFYDVEVGTFDRVLDAIMIRGIFVSHFGLSANARPYRALVKTLAADRRAVWPVSMAKWVANKKANGGLRTYDKAIWDAVGIDDIHPTYLFFPPPPHRAEMLASLMAPRSASRTTAPWEDDRENRLLTDLACAGYLVPQDYQILQPPAPKAVASPTAVASRPTRAPTANNNDAGHFWHTMEFPASDHGDSRADEVQRRRVDRIEKNYPQQKQYAGVSDDTTFQYRAQKFLTYCRMKGITNDYVCLALPAMMGDDESYDLCLHLYDQLTDDDDSNNNNNKTDWRAVLDGMMAHFESGPHQYTVWKQWRSLSLQDVVAECPGKPLSDVVVVFYARLARIFRSMQPAYERRQDAELYDRLVEAFREYPATHQILPAVITTKKKTCHAIDLMLNVRNRLDDKARPLVKTTVIQLQSRSSSGKKATRMVAG